LGIITKQKRYEEELEKARENLEGKVEQRTQELLALTEELSAVNEELHDINRELLHEVAERKRTEEQLTQKSQETEKAYTELKNAQSQVIHQEKMASIGQLAAGVAHEINNPLGYVLSNFETLQKYVTRLLEMVTAFRALHQQALHEQIPTLQEQAKQLSALEKQKKLDYILQDLEPIFNETGQGLARVGEIVKALRLFSRVDQQAKLEDYKLNEGVQNSLLVSRNEVKYVAEIKEAPGELPVIKAIGGQINQVILNLLLNAAYAIKAKGLDTLGLITVTTYADELFVYCSVSDNGIGISEKAKKDIFNAFFTTKPVGQGTGLGLSISYDIIVNKHGGEIFFDSQEGIGTTFTFKLPRSN
jgi:signal transduction histidine kinase